MWAVESLSLELKIFPRPFDRKTHVMPERMKRVERDVSCWKNVGLLRVQRFDAFETYVSCDRISHISSTQPESRLIRLTCHRHGRTTRSEGDAGANRSDFLP